MNRLIASAFAVVGLGLVATAPADASTLKEVLFNLNGTTYHNTFAVPGLNSSLFDAATGLGTLTLTFSPGVAGAYFFDAFLDHQLHDPFFNEFGAVGGAPGAGVSWQIDEPGFGDGNRTGTISGNVSANALDNTNHVPGTTSNLSADCGANGGGAVDPACNNDVSMALGFNFILAANEFIVITVNASPTPPSGGFFLRQHDPDSPGDVFLTATLAIQPGPPPTVPEPGTWLLVGAGVIALAGWSLGHRVFPTWVD